MIRASQLACARGPRTVLRGVSLALNAGEVMGVLGANGAGKTSLLATLTGELPPASGTLMFDDRALHTWTPAALARRRAVLPQSATLAFDLTVTTVVEMGAYPFPELTPHALDALVDRALDCADALGLRERRYAALSGGEQQRVHFARVLVQALAAREAGEYRAIFLDEPTASLDPLHQTLMLRGVWRLVREEGLAAFVVLHDVNLAATWCDRLLMLSAGEVTAQGAPADVLTPQNLQRVYGLPARVLPHPEAPERPLVVFQQEV